MENQSNYEFDLFISYARIPDGMLAKELERFLESFHRDLVLESVEGELRPLNICIDNTDFNDPPVNATESQKSDHRNIRNIILNHLQQARELLVLCSERAVKSEWVREEIEWFIENRGPGAIRIAYTQGAEPLKHKTHYLPERLRSHGFDENMAYDFRGYDERRAKKWQQVEDFNHEMVKLAAHLHGRAPGQLYPPWIESELQRSREKSMRMSTTARLESLIGDPAHAVLDAYEAHQIHPGDESENALKEAYKIAIYHHYNRRESSRISGAGPSYLAGRWKQGDVFVKNSPDGRYQLFVTERGKDGGPAGDVYLLSNETMHVIKLEPESHAHGRVEEVAFAKDSCHVFVTRYFNLMVYSLDGKIIGEYYFGRHTKSPVHIVAGYFHKRYLLAGETKGGLWIVDPFLGYTEQKENTRQVYREFHRDATIHIDICRNGSRAVLVFESGKSQLLGLAESGAVKLLDILPDGVLYAGFFADQDDTVVTSGVDGIVRLWKVAGGAVSLQVEFEPLDTAIDWVTVSADQKQLAVVGSNQTMHILDMENLLCLRSIDYKRDIDWGAVRSVKIPKYEFKLPAAEATTVEPIDASARKPEDYTVLDDEKWFFTTEKSDDYSGTFNAWRVEDDQARLYETHVSSITKHQDILWLHSQFHFNQDGIAYWIAGNTLRRFPARDVKVNTILETENGCWLGTNKGAYFHNRDQHRLVTPLDVNILVIKKYDNKIYAGSKENGAYIIEEKRTVLITEPFLRIKDIKAVAGDIWLLTTLETGGYIGQNGPAYLVEGYFTRPFPGENAEVSDVVEEDGGVKFVKPGPYDFMDFSNFDFDLGNLKIGMDDDESSNENTKG